MKVTTDECRAIDVCDEETGNRLGFLIEAAEPTPRRRPRRDRKGWIVVAVLPSDGRDMILGTVSKPRPGIEMLLANEALLERGR